MWPFESNGLNHRTVHELNSFSIAFLQNLQHQVVQDPWDVLFCELGNLKRRLGALLTPLGKDSHLHLPPGFPLTPVHVEKDLNLGRGPVSRAQGTLEPMETEDKTHNLAQYDQVVGCVGRTHRDVIWWGSWISGKKSWAPCSCLHHATDTQCDPRVCLPWKQQITNPWSWKGLWENSKSSVIILEMRHTLETCHAWRPSKWKSQDWSSSLLTPNQGFLTCRCKWIRGYMYKSPKNPELKSTNRYKWMWINAAVWMFVYPPNFHIGILTPKVMVLESGAFRRWLGCEGRALGTQISAPTEASRQSNSAPSAT